MRTPIVAGNWKCHKTSVEAVELIDQLKLQLKGVAGVDVLVCPSFTALSAAAGALKGSTIGLGAQDLFWEPQGAFTGEVSAPMLVEVGCRFVIIGHSERRQFFGETDQTVNKKLLAALAHGLTPIVCVGETLQEREQGKTFDVVGRQLGVGLASLTAEQARRIVLAYEPVWAIGTGKTATPQQAQEVHAFIRQRLHGLQAADVRIQYGGSVNAANAAELLGQPDIDGALVGGASLKPADFAAIVKAAAQQKLVAR
jgi:triosephosphate isomerase